MNAGIYLLRLTSMQVTGRCFSITSMAIVAITIAPLDVAQDAEKSFGDRMIEAYLRTETSRIEAQFDDDLANSDELQDRREQYLREYLYMLGLDPLPERSGLRATITGTVERDDYVVDNLHYQSVPRLYVTANLYRPKDVETNAKLPAVLYVCGHASRGRDGNKTAYQSHGIWFARHGYVCLVVDSLQLGEIAAIHHGTYNLQRWSWHSRGYTPAGVEAWNGVRAIDYLGSRSDVDPERIGVTGISGGGASTFWIAAADERVKVAVPISGMADLQSYVSDHVIDGHCDCMFMYNTFRWPWTRIAALITPRPLLVINSDQDPIFPMDANNRNENRLKQVYARHGAGERFGAITSAGGHDYRQDIRQAAYQFINTHLKDDAHPVTDSEADIHGVGGIDSPVIPANDLRVFAADSDIPSDQLNTTIDEHFVSLGVTPAPRASHFEEWRKKILTELRRTSFNYFPQVIPAAKVIGESEPATLHLRSEDLIEYRIRPTKTLAKNGAGVLLVVLNHDEVDVEPDWVSKAANSDEVVVYCMPRGVGATRWTTRNPANYVERAHALLGRTVDAGRVWDVIAAAKHLRENSSSGSTKPPTVRVAGRGRAGVIAAYAAALEPQIAGALIATPQVSHVNNDSPQFLNVLRTCDIPTLFGLIAPRPLTILESSADNFSQTQEIYSAAGAEQRLSFE